MCHCRVFAVEFKDYGFEHSIRQVRNVAKHLMHMCLCVIHFLHPERDMEGFDFCNERRRHVCREHIAAVACLGFESLAMVV